MANQFIRYASLVIGNETKGIDLSQLQFDFHIKQADTEFPQSCSIQIYNVSPATINAMKAQEFTRVILSAGYVDGAQGVIFDGQIIQARLGRDSPVDTYINLLCAEGYSSHQAVLNTTLAAGSSLAESATTAAKAMNDTSLAVAFDSTAKLPRGQVLYGMARDKLHEACTSAGYSYFYQGGKIVTVPLQGFVPGTAVVLNADTGLIGWPEQTELGIRIRCLLNPLLAIGSQLKIDNASIQRADISAAYQYIQGNLPSPDADGLYRIYVIEHHGDTRGQDWYSDIVALSLDPSNFGLTPLFQKGQG